MKIYTKFGDRGQTALFDGTRVGKDDLRIETYGTVDELNSVIGVAIAQSAHERVTGVLVRLQRELFVLGSDLATPAGSKNEGKVKRIGAEEVAGLEREIDLATAELPALKNFILPGGSVAGATLHVARTVCRRAERCLVGLMHAEGAEEESQSLIYLNRLSDLLFTLARLANKLEGRGDVEWHLG
ncbi:MAG TPA: cob(I)yrinic acid a,c-diamide adenosyltransferase [Phycisphaerae bacterium]|nr:cob(I)yrinic acid a,c-diamide adenosyltransferase [Phycisphaerae bacterium]